SYWRARCFDSSVIRLFRNCGHRASISAALASKASRALRASLMELLAMARSNSRVFSRDSSLMCPICQVGTSLSAYIVSTASAASSCAPRPWEATSSSTAQAKPSSSQRLARMVSFFMKFISRTSCTKPSVVDAGDGFAIHQQVNVEQHDHVVLAREDAVD